MGKHQPHSSQRSPTLAGSASSSARGRVDRPFVSCRAGQTGRLDVDDWNLCCFLCVSTLLFPLWDGADCVSPSLLRSLLLHVSCVTSPASRLPVHPVTRLSPCFRAQGFPTWSMPASGVPSPPTSLLASLGPYLTRRRSWVPLTSRAPLGCRWQSLLAVFLGGVTLSVVIVLNGLIGARLHTPFAVRAPTFPDGNRG